MGVILLKLFQGVNPDIISSAHYNRFLGVKRGYLKVKDNSKIEASY